MDACDRAGRKDEMALMHAADWYLLNSLIQDMRIINNGLASVHFREKAERQLVDVCDGEETIQLIRIFI